MPILNIKITKDADSPSNFTGAATSVDENWVELDDNFAGSVTLSAGHHWIAWLVSGPSGTKFTVKGWTADAANPLFAEKRTITVGRSYHQGNKGFML